MTKTCPQKHCYAPEVTCYIGELKLGECTYCKQRGEAEAEQTVTSGGDSLRLPWSGNSLGVDDLPFIVARSSATVIGVLGLHNAGKTTLLAAWYLLLGKGQMIETFRFAGSYSLAGWEQIANSFQLKSDGPTFPVHTPTAGRVPGLLHWAFRDGSRRVRDFIFTDAAGEWFKRWSVDRDADDSAGARWISASADVFVVLADCESLSGPNGGVARHGLELLLERLGTERSMKPVALVWSKADIAVPSEIRNALRSAAELNVPGFHEFFTSVYPEDKPAEISQQYLNVLKWAISQKRKPFCFELPQAKTDDPFLEYPIGRELRQR